MRSSEPRRKFFAEVADTDTPLLPVHFGLKADGDCFDYRFKRG